MLKEAGNAFVLQKPDKEVAAEFKYLLRAAKEFGSRRNDIAHAVVTAFDWVPSPNAPRLEPERDWRANGYCLAPPNYISNKNDANYVPSYIYTSGYLASFARSLFILGGSPISLMEYLRTDVPLPSSDETRQPPDHG
jgi:hypothetical protein